MPSSTPDFSSQAPVPLAAVRRLALHAQALDTPEAGGPAPGLDAIAGLARRLGCVQIDTLHVVARSQYLVLWSRLGNYRMADLDRLAYDPQERRLFEYWQHAAAFIPLEDFRYQLPFMRQHREGAHSWSREWLKQPENAELVAQVLEAVRENGPVRVADFEYNGHRRGSWWDWKPAKIALEHLYNSGELMIRDRVNFQRVYDLTGRVLPDWVDTTEPTLEERLRHRLEQAVRAFGLAGPVQAAEYAYLKRTTAGPALEDLLREGRILSVPAELCGGRVAELLLHRDALPLLQAAADGALPARRTTFLSPFDSLCWSRSRILDFWGFEFALEAYVPASRRRWGYYSMPILHGENLVGRFDPSLDRKTGTLRLKSIWLEEGVEVTPELVASLAAAFRSFLAFHQASTLVIDRSQQASLAQELLLAL